MVAWLHACVPAGSVVEAGGVDRGRRVTYAAGQWNGTGGSGYVPHQIHIFFRPRRARSGLFFPAPLWTRQEYDASPRRPHAASCNAWLIAAHPSMATDAAKIMRRAGRSRREPQNRPFHVQPPSCRNAHNYVRNLGARLWASTCLVLFTFFLEMFGFIYWINRMTHKDHSPKCNVMLIPTRPGHSTLMPSTVWVPTSNRKVPSWPLRRLVRRRPASSRSFVPASQLDIPIRAQPRCYAVNI